MPGTRSGKRLGPELTKAAEHGSSSPKAKRKRGASRESEAQGLRQLEPELSCSICHNLLLAPHVLCCNSHVSCQGCVVKWLKQKKSTCPECREEMSLVKSRQLSACADLVAAQVLDDGEKAERAQALKSLDHSVDLNGLVAENKAAVQDRLSSDDDEEWIEQGERLISAAIDGNVNELNALRNNVDLNFYEENEGNCALIVAARQGHVDFVQRLLELRASVNQQNMWGETAVFQASARGHLDIVERLSQAGANLNLETVSGWSPLQQAVICNHHKIVAALIEAGAEVNGVPRPNLSTSLFLACPLAGETMDGRILNIKLKILKLLCQAGAFVDSRNLSPLEVTPLMQASSNGQVKFLKALLEAGASVDLRDCNGRTALMMAAENGHVKAVSLLLAAKANKNIRCNQKKKAEDYAIKSAQSEKVLGLLVGSDKPSR